MRAQVLLLSLLLFSVTAFGCSGKKGPDAPEKLPEIRSAKKVTVKDPKGPIPPPKLPPDLARAGKQAASVVPPAKEEGYAYTVECTVEEAPLRKSGSASGGTAGQKASGQNAFAQSASDTPASDKAGGNDAKADDGKAAAQTKAIVSTFQKASILYKLKDKPPATVTGLEQRLSVSLGEGRAVLNSYGYYSGKVRGSVEKAPASSKSGASRDDNEKSGGKKPVAVAKIVFTPGPQYTIGKTTVNARLPQSAKEVKKKIPKTLADVDLPGGAPAVAADVLSAVDRAQAVFLEYGFPYAKVSATRYVADHSTHTLEAEVDIDPGPFVLMGDVERTGAPSVNDSYLENQRTWRQLRPWSQKKVNQFHDRLRQSGLFQSITIVPGDEAQMGGVRTVKTELQSAPERTVSGALKYHSEFGPGVQGAWEHRNLTGRGDNLRISAPLWTDMQEVVAHYRLPFFLDRKQNFIAKASVVHADIDAYRMTAAAASAGIERRLSRFWNMTAMGHVEGGDIKEHRKPERDYLMYGLPLTVAFDNTKSLLNPEHGGRFQLSVAPYTGSYNGDFTVVRARVDGNAYIPVIGEDKLIMALRSSVGVVEGASSHIIPPSIRFYSGGGGSVRGYEFQSLGPRDNHDKPEGGGSMAEVSAEMRYKVQPEWGFVAFVDGGTAYTDVFADPGREFHWGAGLGFRYYTAVGPVRLDVATPLNPRSDDPAYQLYISIGQSF
ncbi:BamA/TamA family outer membrane protein [Desulfovibrio sp. OttesenSCG-928-G15]|nr:BamA/TamA family outer membrane protein [Desulfovibrio sp. OttesenSCG-928-G15]